MMNNKNVFVTKIYLILNGFNAVIKDKCRGSNWYHF
jgi:hypothetical protein